MPATGPAPSPLFWLFGRGLAVVGVLEGAFGSADVVVTTAFDETAGTLVLVTDKELSETATLDGESDFGGCDVRSSG
jgi:hypothetical protein